MKNLYQLYEDNDKILLFHQLTNLEFFDDDDKNRVLENIEIYYNKYYLKIINKRIHLLPPNSSSYIISAFANVFLASVSRVVSITKLFSSIIISPFGPIFN